MNNVMVYVFGVISLIMTIITILLSVEKDKKSRFYGQIDNKFNEITRDMKELQKSFNDLKVQISTFELMLKFGNKELHDLKEEYKQILDSR